MDIEIPPLRGESHYSCMCGAKSIDPNTIILGSYETRAMCADVGKTPRRFYHRNSSDEAIEVEKPVKIRQKPAPKRAFFEPLPLTKMAVKHFLVNIFSSIFFVGKVPSSSFK